jgi:hypothetical protein
VRGRLVSRLGQVDRGQSPLSRCNPPTIDELVGTNGTIHKKVAGKPPLIDVSYDEPTNREGRPFMPLKFAVAAYRPQHPGPFYVLNETGAVSGRSSG